MQASKKDLDMRGFLFAIAANPFDSFKVGKKELAISMHNSGGPKDYSAVVHLVRLPYGYTA
jgi:hypothetical protein